MPDLFDLRQRTPFAGHGSRIFGQRTLLVRSRLHPHGHLCIARFDTLCVADDRLLYGTLRNCTVVDPDLRRGGGCYLSRFVRPVVLRCFAASRDFQRHLQYGKLCRRGNPFGQDGLHLFHQGLRSECGALCLALLRPDGERNAFGALLLRRALYGCRNGASRPFVAACAR